MQIDIESDCKVLLYADDTAILFSDINTGQRAEIVSYVEIMP
jgi:hypothetical protein